MISTQELLQKINSNPGTGIDVKKELVGGLTTTYRFTRDQQIDRIYTSQYYSVMGNWSFTSDEFLQNFAGNHWIVEERVKTV